jgi:hypothetical protein
MAACTIGYFLLMCALTLAHVSSQGLGIGTQTSLGAISSFQAFSRHFQRASNLRRVWRTAKATGCRYQTICTEGWWFSQYSLTLLALAADGRPMVIFLRYVAYHRMTAAFWR